MLDATNSDTPELHTPYPRERISSNNIIISPAKNNWKKRKKISARLSARSDKK